MKVVFVQPYVPEYRVKFFELLAADLHERGIELEVIVDGPSGDLAQRGDQAVPQPWVRSVNRRLVRVAGRSVPVRSILSVAPDADLYVVLAQGTSLDTYAALLRQRRRGAKVALWGHIGDYVSKGNWLDRKLERWQMRHADHVFAYVPSGAAVARAAGVAEERVTTLMNATDSRALRAARDAVTAEDTQTLRDSLGIGERPCVLYVGALDAPKRIDLLSGALDVLWGQGSPLHLLVAGEGPDRALLKRAVERGQATLLGRRTGRTLAEVAALSNAIVVPGRVGLVAVDALALGLPVVTTDYPFHAPEFEYLSGHGQVAVARAEPEPYAAAIEKDYGRARPRGDADRTTLPSIELMCANVSRGVQSLLFRGV